MSSYSGARMSLEPPGQLPLPNLQPQSTEENESVCVQTPLGCPGQELPLEGKPSFLSYPLGLHAQRDIPWGVEFGPKLIIRSHDCKRHSETSGVCYPCKRLLRHPIVRGIVERNEDGIHPHYPLRLSHCRCAQTLLRKIMTRSTA
jgi:hypothetical protein